MLYLLVLPSLHDTRSNVHKYVIRALCRKRKLHPNSIREPAVTHLFTLEKRKKICMHTKMCWMFLERIVTAIDKGNGVALDIRPVTQKKEECTRQRTL